MKYTVIIRKEHCENADYQSNCDCPLARAIREQLSEIDLRSVGGCYIRFGKTKEEILKFDLGLWNSSVFRKIASGKINNYKLTLTSTEKIPTLGVEYDAVSEALSIINKPIIEFV